MVMYLQFSHTLVWKAEGFVTNEFLSVLLRLLLPPIPRAELGGLSCKLALSMPVLLITCYTRHLSHN